jgi:transposase
LPFLKNLPGAINHIKETKFRESKCTELRLYVMDESRFGLLSIARRCLTRRGVKPIVPYQHRFKNFYLFGAYAPCNGDHFTLEMPYCNADGFQHWMDEFSKHNADEFKLVVLDNGAFHKALTLGVPDNIALLFLPPYSPELNPAEMMWRHIKDRLGNLVFDSLEALSEQVVQVVRTISRETVQSITGWILYTTQQYV